MPAPFQFHSTAGSSHPSSLRLRTGKKSSTPRTPGPGDRHQQMRLVKSCPWNGLRDNPGAPAIRYLPASRTHSAVAFLPLSLSWPCRQTTDPSSHRAPTHVRGSGHSVWQNPNTTTAMHQALLFCAATWHRDNLRVRRKRNRRHPLAFQPQSNVQAPWSRMALCLSGLSKHL